MKLLVSRNYYLLRLIDFKPMMRMVTKRSGLALVCFLVAVLLAPVSLASTTLSQEAPTVSSDKSIYKLGETVKFSLPSGLEADQTYYLEISR